jgi:hypothetical protein
MTLHGRVWVTPEGARIRPEQRCLPAWRRLASMSITTNRQCCACKPASPVAMILLLLAVSVSGFALERPDVEYRIFQFPADNIPRIDGDPSDWSIVPVRPTHLVKCAIVANTGGDE